jgi:hypothetical protein
MPDHDAHDIIVLFSAGAPELANLTANILTRSVADRSFSQ